MSKIKFSQKHTNQFKKIGIQTIYLFGSRAQGKTHALSDFDIGVVFENPQKYKNKTFEVYSKLYDIFTDVLPKAYLQDRFKMRRHEFDLVFLQFAPISLQFEASRNSIVLYESNAEKRFTYEEKVINHYCDLGHIFDLSYKALLERL